MVQRAHTDIARRTREAHFPFLRSIEGFDFSHQSTRRRELLGSHLVRECVPAGRTRALQRRPGRGKTNLAIAIAYKAIHRGYRALFTTAAQLVEDLGVAADEGTSHKRLKRCTAPDVSVVDEVGYRPPRDNALYHVVNKGYLHQEPISFATNKELTRWDQGAHGQLWNPH